MIWWFGSGWFSICCGWLGVMICGLIAFWACTFRFSFISAISFTSSSFITSRVFTKKRDYWELSCFGYFLMADLLLV